LFVCEALDARATSGPCGKPKLTLSVREIDVVVIGGGAAGLFCAIEAGKRGRQVVVLEHADRIGKKIAISGGGRCNFTNVNTGPDNFISHNPHFAKSALAQFTPSDFVSLVEKHGIAYHEKKLGQLFCDERSNLIIDMLLKECRDAGVRINCNATVRKIVRNNSFEIEVGRERLRAKSLVIATGGLSIPSLGATDFGYRVARQFHLAIEPPRPGLVPFILAPGSRERLSALTGIAVDSIVDCEGTEFRENILVTHRGLSGPAILQISSYWSPGLVIGINLLPDIDASELLTENQRSEVELANLLSQFLPRRFAHKWCELNGPSRPLKHYSVKELNSIGARLNRWEVTPAGTEGFRKAEVTAGGVATEGLLSRTMETRKVPGLYFIGEVVDVTGQLGGYNFQWAWSSGFAAGQSV
jgi:predicted Rossmann fold flavoprotein